MMVEFLKRKIKKIIFYRRYIYGRHIWSISDMNRKYSSVRAGITDIQIENIKKFWSPYIKGYYARKSFNIKWFDIYNSFNTHSKLEWYIPDDFYHCFVDTYFSNPQSAKVLDNKNMYDMYFGDVKQPRTIARKIDGALMNSSYELISEDQLIDLCISEGNIIIKKSVDSAGGEGIVFWDKKNSVIELKHHIARMTDVVVQEVIEQHPDLALINKSSINTIRIMTLAYGGEIKVLSSIIRMGVNGMRVDNATSGGLVCGIDNEGRLRDYAVDIKANKYLEHPSGIKFSDIVIPNFSSCIEFVKKLAPRFYSVSKLISWDLSIGTDGTPILIEVNLSYGGVSIHQMANGPIFGELTETILTDILNNNELLN